MRKRPVQYFSKEYLEKCKQMTPDQIVEYVENFRELMCFQIENKTKHSPDTSKREK